jgi:hypothetical protein
MAIHLPTMCMPPPGAFQIRRVHLGGIRTKELKPKRRFTRKADSIAGHEAGRREIDR